MASRNAMNAADKKLLDNLQSDLRQLSNEAKRKFPAVKEVCRNSRRKYFPPNSNEARRC